MFATNDEKLVWFNAHHTRVLVGCTAPTGTSFECTFRWILIHALTSNYGCDHIFSACYKRAVLSILSFGPNKIPLGNLLELIFKAELNPICSLAIEICMSKLDVYVCNAVKKFWQFFLDLLCNVRNSADYFIKYTSMWCVSCKWICAVNYKL